MDLDFSRDDIEKMLLKKASLDKKWMNILVSSFDERFFKTPYLNIIATLQVKYYEKYGSSPNSKELVSMVKAYAAKYPDKDVDLAEANQLINAIQNFDLSISDEVINGNLKEFIRRNAFYNA